MTNSFELWEGGGEIGEEVGVGSVDDGAFGDYQIVGRREFCEKFGNEGGGTTFDQVAVYSEAGGFFGQ